MTISIDTTNRTGGARSESPTKVYRITAMIPTQLEVEAKSLDEAGKIAKSLVNQGEKITFPVYGEARREAQPFPLGVEILDEGVDK